MATQTSRASIRELMTPGISGFVKKQSQLDNIYSKIYAHKKSDRMEEVYVAMGMTGTANETPEGSLYNNTGGMRVLYTQRTMHRKVTVSFPMTEEAIKDNLYSNQTQALGSAIHEKIKYSKELNAMVLFNNATNPLQPIGDGEPLLSTNRPTLDGNVTYSNMLATPADMSPTSVEALWYVLNSLRNIDGELADVKGERFLYGLFQQANAIRVLQSVKLAGTNNNDINYIRSLNICSEEPVVMRYLQNQSVWGIKTKVNNGFVMYEREPVRVISEQLPQGGPMMFTGMTRYSFDCLNPLAFVGSASAM